MSKPECWRQARGLPRCGAASELARLRAELETARRLNLALAERVAAQSELLARSAGRTLNPVGETMEPKDITCEAWREYDWNGRVYRIENPVSLYCRSGGTTHRVVDAAGVVHCCPAPGQLGCVLRWQSKNPAKPVDF